MLATTIHTGTEGRDGVTVQPALRAGRIDLSIEPLGATNVEMTPAEARALAAALNTASFLTEGLEGEQP